MQGCAIEDIGKEATPWGMETGSALKLDIVLIPPVAQMCDVPPCASWECLAMTGLAGFECRGRMSDALEISK